MTTGAPTSPLRVVLAEDQAMIRDAFGALLALQPDLDVVATAADGEAALQAVRAHDPDLLLTDIEMPRMTGLELAERVRDEGHRCRVVIVTTFARSGYLRRALDAGALAAGVAGYVLKADPIDELVAGLRRVHAGERVIAPDLAVLAWDTPIELTDRERDVLRLAEQGVPNRDIAAALFLAEGTVRNYLSSAIAKLQARNKTEAAARARDLGLL